MGRITVRTKNGDAIVPYSPENSISFIGGAVTGYRGKAIDRLAEYEDGVIGKKTCKMVLEIPEKPFNNNDEERYFTCSECKRLVKASLTRVNSGAIKYCAYCGSRIGEWVGAYSRSCHKSAKLDALIGKRVMIIFFDDDVQEGKLKVSQNHKGRYSIERDGKGDLDFRKSHVKRIAEIPNGLKARYAITDDILRGGV